MVTKHCEIIVLTQWTVILRLNNAINFTTSNIILSQKQRYIKCNASKCIRKTSQISKFDSLRTFIEAVVLKLENMNIKTSFKLQNEVPLSQSK